MRIKDRLNRLTPHPGYNGPALGVITAIAGAVSVLGTIKQMGAAKKAAKQEKKRVEGAQRQTQVEAEQARRRGLRERMIAQGQVISQGANAGVGIAGTSGVQGAISSVGSQFATNVGNINVREGSAISMANTQSNINQSLNQANQWGQISSLGMNVMQNAPQIASIFKK
jgi:hypothetical protein